MIKLLCLNFASNPPWQGVGTAKILYLPTALQYIVNDDDSVRRQLYDGWSWAIIVRAS